MTLSQIYKEKILKVAKEFYLWRATREPNIRFRTLCDWLYFKYPEFLKYNEVIWNIACYIQFENARKNNSVK